MKLRRSDRMVVISNYLINGTIHFISIPLRKSMNLPNLLFQKDIVIIKRAFEEIEIE